ncbi:MAG: hypothetical protein RLZZ524_1424, partial [Pseudomonadota bacterium]
MSADPKKIVEDDEEIEVIVDESLSGADKQIEADE